MISYPLTMNSDVALSVCNLIGQKVATCVHKKQPSGNCKVQWDASGSYIYKLKAGSFEQSCPENQEVSPVPKVSEMSCSGSGF